MVDANGIHIFPAMLALLLFVSEALSLFKGVRANGLAHALVLMLQSLSAGPNSTEALMQRIADLEQMVEGMMPPEPSPVAPKAVVDEVKG